MKRQGMKVFCSRVVRLIIPVLSLGAGLVYGEIESTPEIETVEVTGRQRASETFISATKTGAPLIETPQAISIVDSDFIDELNLRTISESMNYSSGVRSQAFGSDTRIEYYQLRGFANQNFYKDGLVLYNSGSFLSWTTPVEGVERLEMLKGPSSALYGSGNTGGLVNIVSKAPVETQLLGLEVGADEYGSAYVSADVGGAISETLSYRGVGLVRQGDTQVELAEDNRNYFMGALNWHPSEITSLTLRGSYTADDSNRPTGFIPYAGAVKPLPDGQYIPLDIFVSDPSVDKYDRKQSEFGYEFERTIADNIRFVSNGRYAEIDLVYSGLYGLFRGNPVYDSETQKYFLSRGNAQLDAELANWTIDNHALWMLEAGGLSHTFMGGIDYSRSESQSQQQIGSAPPLDIFSPVYGVELPALRSLNPAEQDFEQTGLYIQDQIEIDNLFLVLSARKDWLDIKNVSAATEESLTESSYRAGIVYVFDNGWAPYGNYATSFVPVIGVEDATGSSYKPETGRQLEVGIRYMPENGPVSVSAAWFDISRDGVLTSNPQPSFPRNRSQLGEQQSSGAELEFSAQVLNSLDITGALTAFDIDVSESPIVGTINKAPTATPEFIASLYANYTLPEGAYLQGLELGVGIRHTGKSYADTLNTQVVPSATVFDAALRYRFNQRFHMAFNISNFTDEHYVAACPSSSTCYAGNFRRMTLNFGYSL